MSLSISLDVKIYICLIGAAMPLAMMIFLIVRGRKSPLLFSYLWVLLLVLLWVLHTLYRYGLFYRYDMYAYHELYKASRYVNFPTVYLMGPSFLLFSLLYTGRKIVKKPAYMLLLLSPPVIMHLMIFIKHYKDILYFTYGNMGMLFWSSAVLSYAYGASGIALIAEYAARRPGRQRKQSAAIFISSILPIVMRLARDYYLFSAGKTILDFDFDPTPIGFSAAMTVVFVAIYKFNFLDLAPMALRSFANNIRQGFAAVDAYGRIIDFNEAFAAVFSKYAAVRKNADIKPFICFLRTRDSTGGGCRKIADIIENGTYESYNCEIADASGRYYSIGIRPLCNNKRRSDEKTALAGIITVDDITSYKLLMNELDRKNTSLLAVNEELAATNEQLVRNAGIAEELAKERERTRLAGEMHDSIGHTLTLLITLIKVCAIKSEESDLAGTSEKLAEALRIAKSGLNQIRQAVSGLIPDSLPVCGLLDALRDMAHTFSVSGMSVDLSVEGAPDGHGVDNADVIYRACQEALTNSLKHGKAKHASIVLRFLHDRVKLFIIDDGCGCKEIGKGYGLLNMTGRVARLGGTMEYGSDGECGFCIYIEIPFNKV